MNCPSEICVHALVEGNKRVSPPKHLSFEIRFMTCDMCEVVFATKEQRQRNNKQSNYAYNKYKESRTSLWGLP